METSTGRATNYCPFTRNTCTECAVYRGRHRHVVFCKEEREKHNGHKDHIADYFKALESFVNPWADKNDNAKNQLTTRLKVVDAESGKARFCELEEVKTWDWGNPETMRIIGDRQVTSFQNLVDVLYYKSERGQQEVKLYEFPRFMFLAGG